jgi:hypothetical protein
LFHCSGKVGRLQEPCEFPESANILSSTSVYINEEFSKPTISICNQEDKENAGYENFDNANVAASFANAISLQQQGKPTTRAV